MIDLDRVLTSLKHKRLVRVFFSTYDSGLAREALNILARFGRAELKQSQVVREFYYVEIVPEPKPANRRALEETVKRVEEELKKLKDLSDIKVYYVET